MLKNLIILALILIHVSSKAALSLISGLSSYGLATAGLASIGGGYAYSYLTYKKSCNEFDCKNAIVKGWLLGLILLDAKSSGVKFSKLTPKEIKEFKLSDSEAQAYNSEVTELNLILDEIVQELRATSTIGDSRILWRSYRAYLSDQAFSVALKITARLN